MNEVNYDKLTKSLDRLADRYADYQEMEQRTELRESDKESIRESVIQRFETCYEMLWQHLKKYIEAQGVSVPNAPKDIFRNAHKIGMMDAETLQSWFNYVDLHIGSIHDYSEDKADRVLLSIDAFIDDTKGLYKQMTKEQ